MSANTDSHQGAQLMAALAKSYRSGETAEPGAALDANVLAAARRHIAQKQAVRLIQKKPVLRHWLWLPGAAVLACGAVAMVALNAMREDAGQAGFVQPASIHDEAVTQSSPAYERPVSEPLQAPAVVRSGDACVIRTATVSVAVTAELKRLEEAGCAASVARLRQSARVEQSR